MTLRVGLIGYGRIGAMHAGLLSRFVDSVELAALYEPVPEAAHRAEVETGVKTVGDEAAPFESGIDAVAICSSTPTHPRYWPVRDMAIHDFDMARYLLGEEVVEVSVTATSLVIPEATELGDVDLAFISLRYESGALGLIVNSRAAAYGYEQRIEVNGSKGQLSSVDPPLRHTRLATARGISTPVLHHFFIERYQESYLDQWHEFLALIRGKQSAAATGRDGYAALALAEAAQQSHDTARPVKVETH